MNLALFDPKPTIHDYLTPMYFGPLLKYAADHGTPIREVSSLADVANSIVLLNADYLTPENVAILKNGGNKIVGFSVTDSSWVSQCCRAGFRLKEIDLMFMLTGIQKVNRGHEMILTPEFEVELEERTFLPDEDWKVFNSMRESGRLQSLPYVHAERQPEVPYRSYSTRSQKVLMRGGHHMRRFILALKLMSKDLLDVNSGFVTSPYFQDSMNPQFRYCDDCRSNWKENRTVFDITGIRTNCTNPNRIGLNVSDLGSWNNKCPQSFGEFAFRMGADSAQVEKLLNARWITQQQHLEMLARITFTSDLKWLFSIYAAQRFWDAAMVGCINVLPHRTSHQDYFPVMNCNEHYLIYDEQLGRLDEEFHIGEAEYNCISKNARELYDNWMKPTTYSINTNLIEHIFQKIEQHTA